MQKLHHNKGFVLIAIILVALLLMLWVWLWFEQRMDQIK